MRAFHFLRCWGAEVPQQADENHGLVRGQGEQVPADLVDEKVAPMVEPIDVLA